MSEAERIKEINELVAYHADRTKTAYPGGAYPPALVARDIDRCRKQGLTIRAKTQEEIEADCAAAIDQPKGAQDADQ